MQVHFQYGPTRYSLVVAPDSLWELERRAANVQADPRIWKNAAEKNGVLAHWTEAPLTQREIDRRYYRKNVEARRAKSREYMRRLRARQKAERLKCQPN